MHTNIRAKNIAMGKSNLYPPLQGRFNVPLGEGYIRFKHGTMSTPMLGGWLTDIGHSFASVGRTGIDMFKSLRGDTPDTIEHGEATTSTAAYVVYGTLAAAAAYILLKK